VRIAETEWRRAFGNSLIAGEKPFNAHLRDSVWEVSGRPLPPGTEGGGPYAEVSAKTGQVLRIYHTQE
jgi:hypothetical protein